MRRAAVLSLIAIIGVLTISNALAIGPVTAHGELNFVVGVPQGEFHDELDNNGLGLSGQLHVTIPNTFISAGGSLGFLQYGSETRNEPFSTTIPDVTVDVETKNSLIAGHFIVRAQPQKGMFRPYADGVIGFHYLTTDTEIRGEDDLEEIVSSNNFNDWTLSYGGGGGIMLRIYTVTDEQGDDLELFADMGARYLKGGNAQYLQEGSIRRENGTVTYDIYESSTDLVFTYIGLSATF